MDFIMKLGVAIEDTWDFFHEIYRDLCDHHEVALFEKRHIRVPFFVERTNRRIFKRDLKKFLKRNDVVFFEWAGELLMHASSLPKACGMVVRLHRYEMYRWIDRIRWDAVDKIIFVSEAKRKEFAAKYPQHAGKTAVVFHGIDLEKFPFQPKKSGGDIGILCQMSPRKRVYDLILDFYELARCGKPFRLHVGGGPHPGHLDYWESMHGLVKRLGIENRVAFYGKVSDTGRWFENIDIFVSNSYSEGLQVALMEAMACGCHCLAHGWDGVEEILPAENIFYSGNELQEKLLEFSDKPEAERLLHRSRMRDIVDRQHNIHDTKKEIRRAIEDAGKMPV